MDGELMGWPLTGGLKKNQQGHEAWKTMVALLTNDRRRKISVRSYPAKDQRTRRRAKTS